MKKNVLLSSVLFGSLVIGSAAFAGNSGQAGQSGHSGHHSCIIHKIKCAVKKGFKAGKKAGTKVYDSAQNKVMDSGVAVKKAVTGKKNKTFVKGHYNKNGVHVKGHFRKVDGKKGV